MRPLTLLCVLLLSAASAAAQTPPPIQGVTGTIATDATIRDEHEAGNKIAVAVKKMLPGGNGTHQNPLDAFTERLRVTVRDGESITEGVVIDVNRPRQQITVRLEQGKTQTLLLLNPRAAAAETDAPVVVSYKDPTGATVASDFKKTS